MSIEKFKDNLWKTACEKFNISKSVIEQNMDKEDKEEWDDIIEEFNLVSRHN